MKRLVPLLALLIAAAPAAAKERLLPVANPSAVIARELEFARAAQEKGQWTAFREFAAEDAVMFVPQTVIAKAWLTNRPDPAVSVTWQPTEVWSSCDGQLVVSHGAWQRPGAVGYFTTIWERQPGGGYKWILDHGDTLTEPLAVPDMIPAHVAECPADRRPQRLGAVAAPKMPDLANPGGVSLDGTLAWTVSVEPDGSRNLSIAWRQDGTMQPMLIEQVAAPETGG